MMFGNLLLASVAFASLVVLPALASAGGKVTTFTYAYGGDKALTFKAFEASQLDLSKFPKADKVDYKFNGASEATAAFEFTTQNGCDVVKIVTTEKRPLDSEGPTVETMKLCTGETLYTAEGQLIYVGKTDVAVPTNLGDDDGYYFNQTTLSMFKGARSGKIYYLKTDSASRVIKNSRNFRAGRAIEIGGYYEAQFIHDFVIAKIGFAKAHASAKQALKRTCTEILGGSITGGIEYTDGSYNAGFMTAHATAKGICSAE